MFKLFFFFLFFIHYPCFIKSFEELSIEISMKEERENGTLLIDLRSYLPSLNNSSGYLIKFVRPCSPNIYFDPQNRFVLRLMTIDREELCPYEMNCSLICNLFIQKEEMKLFKLKLNIEDVNDHRARFRKRFYSYNLDENLPLDYRFQLEEAEDKDLFSLKTFYYLNVSHFDSFPFELISNKENHFLELILIEKLGKQAKYSFELIVNDEDQEDKCLIEINILFNQEISPEFHSKLYQFIISNLNQTSIGQVHVKDQQRQIYYRLISSNEEHRNLFHINQTTGEISLEKQENNFHFYPFYQLFIEAFYLNYLSTLTTVEIYFNLTNSSSSSSLVNQENCFIEILIPKLFQLNSKSNQIFIKENSSVPLTILQLFISSSSSLHIQTSSSIEINKYFHLKQLDDEQSLELILIQSFDYEIIQHIQLDFSLNQLNLTRKSIQLFIQNINDCQPSFNQTKFHFQIQENLKYPILLHTFQAFDQDQLNNTNYEIQTADENTFSINSTTGQLWILKSFDREIKSNYSLFVCAFDGLYRSCSSIFIDILDENDNICQFNSSSITLTINENLPSNTFLTQIQAFDPDYQENGTLEYRLSSSTSYLTLNPFNGILRTTSKSFDYELIQTYSSLIVVCDNIHSFPSLCCYLQLYINLIDLNDNLPYLIYPSSNDLFIINYTNKIMPRLKAFDNDIDMKNRLIYFTIIGGTLNSSITIDSLSGQLHLLSTDQLPLYGTLVISLSSLTNIQFTILIHDNQTDPQVFLMSIQQSALLSPLFYLISSISIGILILFLTTISLLFYFFKQKLQHHDDPLMNTPSTTTLSARSLSTNKKIYETYYSFGDSVVNHDVIHL